MPWPNIWTSNSTEPAKRNEPEIIERVQDAAQKAKEPLEKLQRDPNVSSMLQAFTQPQTILATAVLTTACLGILKIHRTYLRRIPEATDIPQSYFRRRSVFGKVTSVGDGDNFRIYHTPGGWLAGWGWLPWRKVPTDRKELKNRTVHIRLAGIDAPELAHFGRPSQAHAQESLDWLTKYVAGRRVRAYVHRSDQYSRVVATAYVWKGLLRRDVGLQMLRAGMATIYEAKTGVEFGQGLEEKYRAAETTAKIKGRGMWAGDQKNYESPRQYKSKYSTGSPTKVV